MIYGSVCSGIEAASVAWSPLGWKAAFLSEIEKFPRAVLAHHYPETPLHGDFTTIKAGEYAAIDVLVGGTPCQSFSIAGLRGGLDDDRGNLALEYLRLADRLKPRWLVWENVPGVLSSNDGRDFGAILGGMVELGYGFAYRVLDAQYFGVAQRRRRVFVVGYLGDWRRAAAVLFERHSLSGHPAPRREARKDVAGVLTSRASGGGGGSGAGTDEAAAGYLQAVKWPAEIAPTLNAAFGSKLGLENQHIDSGAGMFVPPIAFSSKDHGADAMSDLSPTLRAGGHSNSHANAGVMPAICIQGTSIGRGDMAGPSGSGYDDSGVSFTLTKTDQHAVSYSIMPMNSGKDYKARETDIAQPIMAGGPVGGNQGGDFIVQSAVRRLTPIECERLQGFPDGYTDIPWRGKTAPDGPRYKALGNSFAVPVVRWIGERIQAVEDMTRGENQEAQPARPLDRSGG